MKAQHRSQFAGLSTQAELFCWHYDYEEHLWEFANSSEHKSFCFRLYLQGFVKGFLVSIKIQCSEFYSSAVKVLSLRINCFGLFGELLLPLLFIQFSLTYLSYCEKRIQKLKKSCLGKKRKDGFSLFLFCFQQDFYNYFILEINGSSLCVAFSSHVVLRVAAACTREQPLCSAVDAGLLLLCVRYSK